MVLGMTGFTDGSVRLTMDEDTARDLLACLDTIDPNGPAATEVWQVLDDILRRGYDRASR